MGRSRNSDIGSKESNRSKSWQNDFPKEKKIQIAKRGSNENDLACILESTHKMCLQLATAQMTKLP